AFTEFVGMAFMFFALSHAFPWFRVRMLIPDALKLTLVAIATAMLSILVVNIPIPWQMTERSLALVHTCAIGGLALGAAIPLLLLTKAVTASEFRVLRGLLPG